MYMYIESKCSEDMTSLSVYQVDPHDSDWVTNAANLHHSHKHGFGLMSAWNIVNAAKVTSSQYHVF